MNEEKMNDIAERVKQLCIDMKELYGGEADIVHGCMMFIPLREGRPREDLLPRLVNTYANDPGLQVLMTALSLESCIAHGGRDHAENFFASINIEGSNHVH